MNLQEWIDVIRDAAMAKESQIGLPPSQKQRTVVILLFKEYADAFDIHATFAASADWFRHKTCEAIYGRGSLADLDMASVSTLIDELGTNFGGQWATSDKGKEFMCLMSDHLAETEPTQEALF